MSSLFFLASAVLSGCVRERDTDTDLAADLMLGEFAYYDALAIAEDASTKNTGENLSNYKTSGYCATISHDKVNKSIVIDFDTINCMCNDARYRRGQILVNYTGASLIDSGGVTNIGFNNYYINDNQVMGSLYVNNLGRNVAGNPRFAMDIKGKLLNTTSLDTIYWEGSRTRTWISGSSTPVWSDDRYEVIGNGTGRHSQRGFYACNITSPLIKDVNCRYYHTGKIEMQPQGRTLRRLDMGSGNCDQEYIVFIDGKANSILQP